MQTLLEVKPRLVEKVDLAGIVAWAEQHLFERRAVVPEHELMAAALERGRGEDFDLGALRQAIDQRGLLREKGTDKITSREVLRWELAVVVAAKDGRGQEAAMNPDYRTSPLLSAEQTVAVQQILRSRDFITLFRGGAGTGKSYALKEVKSGLAAADRPVVVLAPQRQQVQDLQADGLKADTLASFLQRKQLAKGAVVIVDEAGQVGTQQMADLFRVVGANQGRLILSGDSRQHGSVVASDALRAIEKHAGLKPAVIQTIRRQDPKLGQTAGERMFIGEYLNAVKAAADGNVAKSFDTLDRLGCIREVSGDNLHKMLVAEFLAAFERKEKALVVAQTREGVRQVNEAIRAKMQGAGKLGSGALLKTFQPVDLDEAQKRDARFYQSGHHVGFIRGYGRFAKGEVCRVVGANGCGIIIEKDGVRTTMSYRYADRFVVAAAREMEIAPGDRLQLKLNGKSVEGTRLNNGELVTVREVAPDGSMVVEAAQGARKTLAPSQRLLVRGYAVTSYGSQGKTVDTVIMSDAGNHAATNAKQWYVTISRARKKVLVFTPNKAALRVQVQQAGQSELAMDLKLARPSSVNVRLSVGTRRAIDIAENHRRHEAYLASINNSQSNHQQIHL
jgi:hypothetical protein